MKVYCVVYNYFWDDEKMFSDRREANKCRKWTRRRLKLPKEDRLLRVVEVEVHDKFRPELYEVKE